MAFSPDGKRIASASASGKTVKVWDAQSGAEALTPRGIVHPEAGAAYGHRGPGTECAVTFSPDGNRIASAGSNGTVIVWDAQTGAEALTLRGHGGWTATVTFSPDGTRIALASGYTVNVWDARDLTPELRVEREAVGLLNFLFNNSLPKREVVERVKRDQTISEEVRKKALEFAEQYPERKE